MLSRSNALLSANPYISSVAIHLAFLALFALLFYLDKPINNQDLTFTVVEKFKVVEKIKPAVLQVNKPQVRPKTQIKKRQVYGLSRKSVTSEAGVSVKKGNTIAKTPDTKKLNKDDEDSLPIPADEFLITAMPKVVEEIRPIYPPAAKKQGIEGKVVFEILIDGTGKVRQVVLIKSLGEEFDLAARDAIMRFKFRPAMMEDKPVAVKVKYAINFVLEK